MKESRNKAVITAFFVFILAIFFRLYSIGEPACQSDERLWVERSFEVVERLKTDPRHATTHLGHPGVVPSLIMGAGQLLRDHYVIHFQLSSGDTGFISRLEAARISIALTASLVPLALFLFGVYFIGFWPAALAGFWLAMDPRHIAYSRMAHLDAVLSLFALLTVGVYILGVRKNKLFYKLLAGLCWGLGVATKPTVAILIPVFVLYKLVRNCFVSSNGDSGERVWITWSDFWAVATGHLLFAVIYTRLWDHRGDYRVRLQIKSAVARHLWQAGKYLQHNSEVFIAVLSVLIVLIFGTVFLYRRKGWNGLQSAVCLFVSTAIILPLLRCFPAIFENFARFWTWVAGLSGETHNSFGKIINPVSHQYHSLFYSEVPEIVILGVFTAVAVYVCAVFFFIRSGVHSSECSASSRMTLSMKRGEQGEKFTVLTLMLFIPLIWMVFLSISDKQTWRYMLPAVPFLYLFAGWGAYSILRPLLRKLTGSTLLLLTAVQAVLIFSWHPQYFLYFNMKSEGLKGAIDREHGFMFAGQRELTEFFLNESDKAGRIIYVTVAGDAKLLEKNNDYLFPSKRGKINFADHRPHYSDYFVTFTSHPWLIDRVKWQKTLETEAVFQYEFKGQVLARVYESHYPEYDKPVSIPMQTTHRTSGILERNLLREKMVHAVEDRDLAGVLFFNSGFRVDPGNYSLQLDLKVKKAGAVVTLKLGDRCSREFRSSGKALLKCSVDSPDRLVPQLIWNGKGEVEVGDGIFSRVP